MFGIQPGHTPNSFSIFGKEQTDEATITKEGGGCFGNGKTIIDAGNGNDNILVNTHKDGSVDVFINGEEHNFTSWEAKNLEIRGGKGNDNIVCTGEAEDTNFFGFNFSNDPKFTIDGGKGDDMIMGSSGNDTIMGGKGNDTILGGDGNDTIHGGKGQDTILGGAGNDKVYGDKGRDFVDGGEGKDWVQGGSKERNWLEEAFDTPSKKDTVNEHNFWDRLFQGIRG
jgi:Ca2+-binding RTX toxin-like protein